VSFDGELGGGSLEEILTNCTYVYVERRIPMKSYKSKLATISLWQWFVRRVLTGRLVRFKAILKPKLVCWY
jgi:hypothetical protein